MVFVESAVMEDPLLVNNPGFAHIKDKLMTFSEGKDDLTDKIDFIVCLGGDGTLLYASSLFQQSVPPVMAFHMGSLGFLTPFEIENFEQQITHVLEGNSNQSKVRMWGLGLTLRNFSDRDCGVYIYR